MPASPMTMAPPTTLEVVPSTDDLSLYSVLGLQSTTFTTADVERSAKAALRHVAMNTDLTPQDRAAITYRIHLARRVLTDSLKRRIYDTGGEEALAYVETTFALTATRQFGLHLTLALAVTMFMLVFSTEMIFSLLVSLYVDGFAVSISAIAAPPFVSGSCFVIAALAGFLIRFCDDGATEDGKQGVDELQSAPQRSRSPYLILGSVLMYGVALITLASLIVASVDRMFFVIPAFVATAGETLYIGATVPSVGKESVLFDMRLFGFRHYSSANVICVRLCRFVVIFSRAIMMCVLVLRASGVITCTWYVVFVPGLLMIGAMVVGAFNMENVRSKQAVRRGVDPQPKLGLFLFLCYIMMSSMLAYKLDNWGATPLPLWACFIPHWLAAFILLGMLSIVAIEVCGQDVAMEDP